METGQKKERKSGLRVVTSLGETKDRGRGLKVDPAPLGHWTIGDFCSLGGIKMDSKYPTTGLKHYRPHFPETKRIPPSVHGFLRPLFKRGDRKF